MSQMDNLLQQRLEALEAGLSVEGALIDLPEEVKELAPLVRLAATVRRMPHPKPALSNMQAQAQMRATLAQEGRPRPSWRTFFENPWSKVALASGIAGIAMVMLFVTLALFSFGVWKAGPSGVQTAMLMDMSGSVRVAPSSGEVWQEVSNGDQVREGQRILTGPEGGVTLVFYEGSRATLGPNADVTLAVVDGSWGKVVQVELDQHTGKTNHSVVPLRGESSFYQVHTPSGTASVLGTVFSVVVDRNGQTRFAVDTGKVHIQEGQAEVLVAAGQATMAQPEQTLLAPNYQFNLLGEVSAIEGDIWTVNAVSFSVFTDTMLVGEPQVGSTVFVEGRVLPEGQRVADRIEVVVVEVEEQETTSSFTGILQSTEGSAWFVDGVEILVDERTERDGDLSAGIPVEVTFTVLEDGSWLALRIESLVAAEPEPESEETEEPFVSCTGADPHPTGQKLAQRYGVPYAEIMGWFCQRFGFGEIDLAYELSQASGMPVDEIFAMRRSGLGWGQIKAQLRNVAVTASPEITATVEMTATEEVTVTEEVPVVTETPVPLENTTCTGADPHPTGQKLAARYGVSYEEIMNWFCQGFGFGEIDLAYSLSSTSGTPVADIFAMKKSGTGWGEIKKQFDPKPEKVKPEKTKKPK